MGYHQQRYSRAQADRPGERQAPGAGVEPEPRQPVGRAGAAARLQRRDVRHQRARRRWRSTSATGKQIWRTPVDWVPETPRVVCCGVSNKGAAIYNGKVFRTTLDAHVVALDAKTGKEVWRSEGGRMEGRLFHDGRAADRQRRADHRHFRRRVRHPRLHRRLGSGDRQAAVAPLHHSGARREGQRDLAAGQRRVGSGRRLEPGSPARTIPSSTSPTGASATRRRGRPRAGPATTSTRRRSWRCGRRPARSSGTISSRPTTRTISTPTGS